MLNWDICEMFEFACLNFLIVTENRAYIKWGGEGGGNHPIHGNLQWMMKLKSLFIKIKNCPLLPKNKKTFIDSTIYRRHHEVVQTHCKSLNKKVVYRQQYIHWGFFYVSLTDVKSESLTNQQGEAQLNI